MRKILFRGKREKDREWVYGGFSNYYPCTCPLGEFLDNLIINGSPEGPYHVIPETVGQFTGIRDSLGFVIYEGDIVKFEYPTKEISGLYIANGVFSFTGHVVFEDCQFCLKRKNKNNGNDFLLLSSCRSKAEFRDGRITVIGNIHDNPELLED